MHLLRSKVLSKLKLVLKRISSRAKQMKNREILVRKKSVSRRWKIEKLNFLIRLSRLKSHTCKSSISLKKLWLTLKLGSDGESKILLPPPNSTLIRTRLASVSIKGNHRLAIRCTTHPIRAMGMGKETKVVRVNSTLSSERHY